MYRSLGLLSLLACAAGCLDAAPPVPTLAAARTALAGLPLRFEANQGQWSPDVRYLARSGGVKVALTDRGPSVGLPGGRVDLVLEGAAAPRIQPLDPLAVRTDYFIGPRSNWHTGVASYARVRYSQVYRGIDAVYYGNEGRLEYDFVLAPGADAGSIRMRFRGADRLRITPAGDLEVDAAGGTLIEKRPAVRQGEVAIDGRYVLLARDLAAFRVGSYDRSRPLVIDPLLVYSTYIGGAGDEQVNAVRLTANGLLYITGPTNSTNMPYVNGAYSNAPIAGSTNIFIAILDTSAAGGFQPTYFGYIGGSAIDVPLAMVLDAQGDIYLTGRTTSTDFPVVGNSILSTFPTPAVTGVSTGPSELTDAFVLELNPSLYGEVSLLYTTFLGGIQGNTYGNAIDLDQAGNIYVVGTTLAGDFPLTNNAYQTDLWGGQDTFLIEFNTNSAVPLYSSLLGGELDDDGRAVAVAPNGLVYMAASTESTEFPMAGFSYQGSLAGGYDLIVAVLDPTQFGTESLIYSTYIGGSASEEVRGMAVDGNGNLLLTGYTLSSDFPVTPDAAQPVYGGNGDIFVTVVNPFNPEPQFLVYSTFLGGSDADVGYGIGADAQNNIYVTGYTLSPDLPVTPNAPEHTWPQGVDIVAAKVIPHVAGPSGFGYVTYFGGVSINSGQALAVAPDGTLYVAGFTGGVLTTTSNAVQGSYGGGVTDGFLFVLAP